MDATRSMVVARVARDNVTRERLGRHVRRGARAVLGALGNGRPETRTAGSMFDRREAIARRPGEIADPLEPGPLHAASDGGRPGTRAVNVTDARRMGAITRETK